MIPCVATSLQKGVVNRQILTRIVHKRRFLMLSIAGVSFFGFLLGVMQTVSSMHRGVTTAMTSSCCN